MSYKICKQTKSSRACLPMDIERDRRICHSEERPPLDPPHQTCSSSSCKSFEHSASIIIIHTQKTIDNSTSPLMGEGEAIFADGIGYIAQYHSYYDKYWEHGIPYFVRDMYKNSWPPGPDRARDVQYMNNVNSCGEVILVGIRSTVLSSECQCA